jgi:hypothetical protein
MAVVYSYHTKEKGIDSMYKFYSGPAHGWLAVPAKELEDAGVFYKVSDYSYYDPKSEMVYLEEDCDAGIAFKANIVHAGNFSEVMVRDETFIRSLPSIGSFCK